MFSNERPKAVELQLLLVPSVGGWLYHQTLHFTAVTIHVVGLIVSSVLLVVLYRPLHFAGKESASGEEKVVGVFSRGFRHVVDGRD
jgi:uncharacterized membrane protein|tara:strand:- start:820 stop:1077 length:258 start_codon:yes stop_codon:yes gene_type:complete